MRIEQLFYFKQVVKYGSVNAAAENSFITQPALGAAIKSLEKELGYPLFRRTSSGMQLTKWGEQTYLIANDILAHYDSLEQIQHAYNNSELESLKGSLNISSIKTLSLNILPHVIPAFAISCPAVELSIIEKQTADALYDLQNGICDLALVNILLNDTATFERFNDPQANYHLEPLWDEKLYILLNSTLEPTKRRSISIQQLQDKPLALTAFSFYDDCQNNYLIQKYFPNKQVAFRCNNFDLLQQYIINTNAFSFAFITTTTDIKKLFHEKITYCPLKENIVARFYAIYDKNNPNLKQIEAFVDILTAFCDKIDK